MAVSTQSSFPVNTIQWSAMVCGRSTSFLICAYADRLLLIITQVGSLGTVVQAEKETVLGGGSTYGVTTLLGQREGASELCARRLAEQLAVGGCELPLLLCLGLNRGCDEVQAVREIVSTVLEHPAWRQQQAQMQQ